MCGDKIHIRVLVCFILLIRSGKVLVYNTAHEEYVVESNTLPEDLNWMPILSNGHVAVQVMGGNVYKNGLYNGEQGLSHRARIPNYSNILSAASLGQLNSTSYRMHYRHGMFESITQVNNSIHVRHIVYAHRYYTRAIVNEIYLTRIGDTSGEVRVAIRQDPGEEESEDIHFDHHPTHWIAQDGQHVTTRCGCIREKEVPEEEALEESRPDDSCVCVVWNRVPEEITLADGQTKCAYKFIMTVDRDLLVAEQEMRDVLLRPGWDLFASHVNEWERFWSDFNIQVRGNLELSRYIHVSLYGIVSALPSKQSHRVHDELFYGISPTGLGRGGSQLSDYEGLGHNFWDTETWMFPVVLAMDTDWSRRLLHYRYAKLRAARELARNTHYEGARFPWESAYTGREVTQPCCPEVAENQQHITADIGIAVENYYRATGDNTWMQLEGCALVREIAMYLASRTVFNRSTDKYEVKGVMGPDEDHGLVDNNFYTNLAFRRVLLFAVQIASECNFQNTSNWSGIADKMLVIYDPDGDYHPQYQGYKNGTIVKQADAILGGFPLLYPMNSSTRRNDLEAYERATRSSGPAMTWSMFAINYLDINDTIKADQHFRNCFQKYLEPPFWIWREVQREVNGKPVAPPRDARDEKAETGAGDEMEETGAVNFLTGAGGFLQSILFGYAGLRVLSDRLLLQPPNNHLMPATNELIVDGIKYLGLSIDLIVRQHNRHSLRFRQCSGTTARIMMIVNDREITVDCRRQQTKWYNWRSGGASIKVVRR